MFDPERDDDSGSRPFYLRLLAVGLITLAGCLALWPSVSGFSAGPDHGAECIAITDGWHGSGPSRDWLDPAAACGPESRHRLIVSGLGLGGLAVLVGGVMFVRRTRTNLRRSPASVAGA